MSINLYKLYNKAKILYWLLYDYNTYIIILILK